MDFHIRLRTAHRRLARPAHPSCPHLGDERRKLSARHQQEGTAAIGSGAKPKPENAKRRRPRHQNINRHGSTKINRASQPFSRRSVANKGGSADRIRAIAEALRRETFSYVSGCAFAPCFGSTRGF